MANFFDNDERPTATEEVKEEQKEEVQNVQNEEPLEEEEIVNDYGQEASQTEAATVMKSYGDFNDISVTVSDRKTPIVILFGPPSCGKTMTLIRLSRFLKNVQGGSYMVKPIRTFRPSDDKDYDLMCNEFPQMLNSDSAAKGTDKMSFMLVSVTRNAGEPVC